MTCTLCHAAPRRKGGSHCLDCYADRKQAQHAAARQRALDVIGRSCRRCGFSDPRCLQIDHVNGDGHQQNNRGVTFYNEVCREPERFQPLCANCNWIKRHEEGTHTRRTRSRV
jgi:hypothetical protein